MSRNLSDITYHEAQLLQELRGTQRHRHAVALNAFRNSYCDQFTFRDWMYFSQECGKELWWLLRHAKWSDRRGMFGAFFENAVRDNDHETLETFFLH